MHPKKVCIFIDGENLRHSIIKLFPEFDKRKYLPKAEWDSLFDWIVEKSIPGAERVRSYWYVVKGIDFIPSNISLLEKKGDTIFLDKSPKNTERREKYEAAKNKKEFVAKYFADLKDKQGKMRARARGWDTIHELIEGSSRSVEFRKVGTIKYDLLTQKLCDEKAVDVHLAVDMVTLKDIYDVAVILSGDQDYVPAVRAVKDSGKRVVNVAFLKEDGHLLPGGARRLGQTTDWSLEVTHADLKKFLKL